MPQFLAIEIGGGEARLAVASGHGDRIVVEQILSVALGPSDDPGPDPSDAGARIAAALAQAGINRHDVAMVVGREQVELRSMVLPPAPDDELPDMVRFQALREFHQIDDDWLVDYVPLGEAPEAPRELLVAAMSPTLAVWARQTCAAAGLMLTRLALRPCATASLWLRAPDASDKLTLLVDPFSFDVDLTAMLAGRTVFMRTAKLPGDVAGPDRDRAIVGEVRRTIAAVQNQLGGQRVEAMALVGDDREQAELARALATAFGVDVQIFAPLAKLQLSPSLAASTGKGDSPIFDAASRLTRKSGPSPSMPRPWGRFAPVLGLLADEIGRCRPAIDFINPRRRPAPPSRRNRYVGLAIAAAVLLIGWFFYGRLEQRWLGSELDALTTHLKAATKSAEQAAKFEARVREIDKWTAEEINWLDELYWLSERFPPASEAMIRQLTMSLGPRGGEVKFDGLARAEAIARLREQSNDPRRRVVESGSSQDTSQPQYGWEFSAAVHVAPNDKSATKASK